MRRTIDTPSTSPTTTRFVLQPGDQLHKRLLSAGLVGPADQVARSLYNIEIARSDRTVIYETPEGYGLRRGGNPMEMLSNFVVRILGNVAFGDGSALHHSAAVLVGGKYRERRCQKLNRTRHSRLCKNGSQTVSHLVRDMRPPHPCASLSFVRNLVNSPSRCSCAGTPVSRSMHE